MNHDDSRERLFYPSDALISYLSCRIIGNKLLQSHYPLITNNIGDYLDGLDNVNLSMR